LQSSEVKQNENKQQQQQQKTGYEPR